MKSISLVDPVAGTSNTYNPFWVLASDRTDATMLTDATTKYYQASLSLAFFKKRLNLLGAFRSDLIDRNEKLFLRPLDHPANFGALTRDHFLWRPDAPSDYWNLAATRPRDATTGIALSQYASQRYQDDYNPPATSTKKPTESVGGVYDVGHGVAVWSNFAQTFNPTDFTKTTIDYGTPPPSTAQGVDAGVRVSYGPRLYVTLSRFTSKENNASTSQPSGASSIQTLINTRALGNTNSTGTNSEGLGNVPIAWNDTLDRRSSGYELEMVANLTAAWRMTLNYGNSDGTQTNAYAQTRAWVIGHDTILRKILDDAGIQISSSNVASAKAGVTTANSPDLTNAVNAWNSLQASAANWVTGKQALNRLTKYTANVYSDYRFSEGRARGLRLGYGMQFRGPQVIGYRGSDTIVNPANPSAAIDNPNVDAYTVVWQKAYLLGTATASYPVKLFGRQKVDLNLSVGNLFNYDQPVYNTATLRAPNGDLSSPARVSYPWAYSYLTPRSFRLTATTTF